MPFYNDEEPIMSKPSNTCVHNPNIRMFKKKKKCTPTHKHII